MKRAYIVVAVLMMLALALGAVQTAKPALAQDKLVVYMQMGGHQGDGTTLARTMGARAAAEALGIELVEQYSGWDMQLMINHFQEALAADPDGIVIMGHPGYDALAPLVAEAFSRGIIVTSGNNGIPQLEEQYGPMGFGYAGADLWTGGYLTGKAMVAAGLQAGDEALVYDIWHQELRSRSPQGIKDALEEAGVVVDTLDVSQEVDSDVSLATPVLTAYLEAHPNLKAIGTQHGNITAALVNVLKENGYAPGEIIVGGIDLSPATVAGVEEGYISATFDQVLYLQGYFPVLQIWLTYNYKIPGLHINTGVGVVTPDNIGEIKSLIEQGYR